MTLFETDTLLLFCGGGLVLCLAAILIDRFNFPQRRFRPKRIALNDNGPRRDRTGAHIIDESHRDDVSARTVDAAAPTAPADHPEDPETPAD